MKNILIFTPLPLEQGRGGELSAIELTSGLKNYFNITIVDTNKEFGEKSLSESIINEKLKGVKRDRINFLTISFLNKNFAIPYPWDFLKLFRIVKKNDITYFAFSGVGSNLIFIIYSLLLPRSLFVVGHRLPLYSEKKFSLYNSRMKISFILFRTFEKRFFHHTISYRRKKFLHKYFNSKKVVHVRHCVELSQFISEKEIHYNKDILKFIYAGYLDSEDKGIDVLIEAIDIYLSENHNLKVHFEFCGKGPLAGDIKELEKKFPNHVVFNGYISYDEIADYLRRNDVFLFTSKREAFGRVIIEALASGLLILCAKTIGSNEILRKQDFAFFINELKPQEIIRQINHLYELWKEQPDKFLQLKKSGKSYAIEKYSYENEVDGFKKLFEKVIRFSRVNP